MASTFIRRDAKPTHTNRALVYTVPALTTTIVFAGTVTNIDTVSKADHYITIEIEKSGSVFVKVFDQLPVAFGGTSPIPKIVMAAGEKLHVTVDAANKIEFTMSAVERT